MVKKARCMQQRAFFVYVWTGREVGNFFVCSYFLYIFFVNSRSVLAFPSGIEYTGTVKVYPLKKEKGIKNIWQ